ncbi:right-handed parallel beta-helix repeat-containing protein [Nonomuraea sp. NPDC005983]|uniref:right-handed parallel beta-helix repeat-containing protein n=1 Tax=Nonomuraea sp. NPDC005983 TaxID=3155595 RepID=UPI0033AC56F1
MFHFHVAPSGDDSWQGTQERPFATLERAQAAAREVTGDVVVHLGAGTYALSAPLELTEADSGVVYQGDERGESVISGGREIGGWRERDGVWLADVGDLETRQLYVDGRRAERAAVDALPGTVAVTETGYTTDSTDPQGWHSPGDVEFVYRGVYPWTEARCGVAAVTGDARSTVITMAQPAFGWAAELYNAVWGGQSSRGFGLPTRVENDASFLTEPGTFVLDRSCPGRHVLRYLPRPGEHPERTRVVAPVLETLLRAAGTRNVRFEGLMFADATWLRPSRPEGFLHYHGSGYYDGGAIDRVTFGEDASVTIPVESSTIPACVVLEDTAGMGFEGCHFTRLGATGLGLSGGGDVTVRGCDFDTLSASAVAVIRSRDVLIEDNRIRRIGLDYPGSPGITLLGTRRCTVAQNEVSDVPYCGIVAGPGEGTRILRNLTADTMTVLADGGGVYLSGPQGDSHDNGAVIRGNVIKDTRTPYNFALYTDYGASWVTVEENVVMRADNTSVLQVSPPLEHVVYRGNFWDADPLGHDSPPEGVTYEGNTTIADERKLNDVTAAIQERAGLLRRREP